MTGSECDLQKMTVPVSFWQNVSGRPPPVRAGRGRSGNRLSNHKFRVNCKIRIDKSQAPGSQQCQRQRHGTEHKCFEKFMAAKPQNAEDMALKTGVSRPSWRPAQGGVTSGRLHIAYPLGTSPRFTPYMHAFIQSLICPDATSLWHTSVTKIDVFVNGGHPRMGDLGVHGWAH